MKTLAFEEQLTQLANETVTLVPLHEDHFELLFAVAADPLIWAQHPTPTRYQRAVFATYFAGGIESKITAEDLAVNLDPKGAKKPAAPAK